MKTDDMIEIKLTQEETDWILEVIKSELVLAHENQHFQQAKFILGILDAIED
jgi:hypothetical protein